MSSVALIIIYNHQYNKNIPVLEELYRERFAKIYHLVPFYTGRLENVVPVYCSSFYFQGYIAQGLHRFFSQEFDHYLFIGDDLVLNPAINQENYREHLKLGPQTCFIPRLTTPDQNKSFWAVNFDAVLYNVESPGVEAKIQMPSYAEATACLKKHGLENKALTFTQVWKKPGTFKEFFEIVKNDKRYLARLLQSKLGKDQRPLNYPLVRSYSDIFVVSRDAIRQFAHYCGVTATTRLFVELAVPTSLVFTAQEIVTEKDLHLKGAALWTKEDFALLEPYENKLQKLLEHFPADRLYIHPVKLSQWDTSR